MQKSYTAKIYNLAGSIVKTINPRTINNEVSFSSTINAGQGQCMIDLSLPMDDFGEGTNIKNMNFVRIYEADDENSPEPRLIYTGFISQYVPYFQGSSEGVRLVCLGLATLLQFGYYKSGSNFTVSASAIDPAQIMKNVLDHFNSVFPGTPNWIDWDGGNVDTVGTNVTYEFVDQKWGDVLKKAFDLAGSGRWWYIGPNGQLYFKAKPGTATHRFTLGYDVVSGEIVKNSEQLINKFQLRWNTGYSSTTDFTDATSVSTYGPREKIQNDERITISGTADQRGDQEIADNKDPKAQVRMRINANYDIESIKPGDTCSVFNVKQGSTVFPANMLITAVRYTPDGVDLDLENTKANFFQSFSDAVRAVQ